MPDRFRFPEHDDRPEAIALMQAVLDRLPALKELLEKASTEWNYEDGVYRFYHQSFKVFYVQDLTREIVAALRGLAPGRELNQWFSTIVEEGTSGKFSDRTNQNWLKETRPVIEAFFHARFFLEMAVRYGEGFAGRALPPAMLDSGWAALLYLYNMR